MSRLAMIDGKTFHFLTVITRGEPGSGLIICRCVCGVVKPFRYSNVASGSTHSCGCKRLELMSKNTPNATHRKRYSAEYAVWQGMLSRCHCPTNKNYQSYGARGIFVCPRWRTSFQNFYDDMGARPLGLTIERRNDGPYSPDNCVWADWSTQENNRRDSVRIVLGEESLTALQWSKRIDVPVGTIMARRLKGMPVEKILARRGELGRWK